MTFRKISLEILYLMASGRHLTGIHTNIAIVNANCDVYAVVKRKARDRLLTSVEKCQRDIQNRSIWLAKCLLLSR